MEQTVLSGDRGVFGDPTDNARSVVTVIFPSGIPLFETTLDGFQVRDGNGTDPPASTSGGGIHSFNSRLIHGNPRIVDSPFVGPANQPIVEVGAYEVP